MDKKELWILYCKKDAEFEKAKGRRALIAFLGFAVAYFMVLYAFSKPSDLIGFGMYLLISLILSFVHFWVNVTVFGNLAIKGMEESRVLESIKKRIDEAD